MGHPDIEAGCLNFFCDILYRVVEERIVPPGSFTDSAAQKRGYKDATFRLDQRAPQSAD